MNRAGRRAARKTLSRQPQRSLPAFLGGRPRVLWHYTIAEYLPSILEDGIRPATAFVEAGERPAIWCSYRPSWEPVCNKMVGNDAGDVEFLGEARTEQLFGLARLQVPEDLAPYTWPDFLKVSGIRARMAVMLENVAMENGSDIADWRAGFDMIPPDRFLAVEVKLDGEWVDVASVAV